jgi:hypothetical protein
LQKMLTPLLGRAARSRPEELPRTYTAEEARDGEGAATPN